MLRILVVLLVVMSAVGVQGQMTLSPRYPTHEDRVCVAYSTSQDVPVELMFSVDRNPWVHRYGNGTTTWCEGPFPAGSHVDIRIMENGTLAAEDFFEVSVVVDIIWHDYHTGMELAEELNRSALIFYTHPSDRECFDMEQEVFRDPEVINTSEHFVMIKVENATNDVPSLEFHPSGRKLAGYHTSEEVLSAMRAELGADVRVQHRGLLSGLKAPVSAMLLIILTAALIAYYNAKLRRSSI